MGLFFIKHHELEVCHCYQISHVILFDVAKCLNGSKTWHWSRSLSSRSKSIRSNNSHKIDLDAF